MQLITNDVATDIRKWQKTVFVDTYETEVAHVKHMELDQEEDAEHPEKLYDSREDVPVFIIADANVHVDEMHLQANEELTLQNKYKLIRQYELR